MTKQDLTTVARGLAHEVRNPLNSALIQLCVLERTLEKQLAVNDNKVASQCLGVSRKVRQEIKRLNDLFEEFLALFGPNDLHLHDEALVQILKEMVTVDGAAAAQPNGAVTLNGDSDR